MARKKDKHARVTDPPPPLHSQRRISRRPTAWAGMVCLTAKQWKKLIDWVELNREHLDGKSISEVLEIAKQNCPQGACRCPVRTLDLNVIREACSAARLNLTEAVA